jgi:predicted TPR repeat methyltransferase
MNQVEKLLTQANKAYQCNDFNAAKKHYQQLLKIQPLHAEAMHRLGMLAAMHQQWDEAISWLKKALTIQPNSAQLHHHLANILKKSGQLESALSHYKTALYWEPQYAEAHNNCGTLLFKQKKYAEAQQHYAQAIHLKPDYLEAHFNLGLLFLAQTEKEAATLQFKQVLLLDPHSIQAHWHLAAIYWQQNDLEKVYTHYQALFKLIPHSPELLNNLGALALKQNQLETAIEYFRQALAIEPKHKACRNNLAASLLQKDEFKESIWHYSLYLNLEPQDKEALYNRAQGLMLTGQLNEAIADLKKILALDANAIDTRCNLAAIYLKLDDKNAAINAYEEVLSQQKDHPIASYMLSALKQRSIPSSSPLEYVKNLFDNYAFQFDTHLQETLQYKTPTLLYEQIAPYLKEKKYNILDLGCGTGLSGEPFIGIAETLTGIDISKKMLARAKIKNYYDELIENDILSGLALLKKDYDLILCVDTLVYFGELDELFSKIVSRLEPDGLFSFSIELANKSVISYHLQISGRYQHTCAYIEKIATKNHLKCLRQTIVDGRYQKNEFVKTALFVLKKESNIK